MRARKPIPTGHASPRRPRTSPSWRSRRGATTSRGGKSAAAPGPPVSRSSSRCSRSIPEEPGLGDGTVFVLMLLIAPWPWYLVAVGGLLPVPLIVLMAFGNGVVASVLLGLCAAL